MRSGMNAGLAFLALVGTPALWSQQEPRSLRFGGVTAGLYSGSVSSYNGPFLAARFGRQVGRFAAVGVRAEYRDDDWSGGRAQSVAVGPELFLHTPAAAARVHAVIGAMLDGVHMSAPPSARAPDLTSGLHPRAHVGTGADVRVAATNLGFEVTYGLEGGRSYTMVGLGLRSEPGTARNARAPAAYLQTNRLVPLTDRYRPDPAYHGYTTALDFTGSTPLGHAVRVSLGVDFLGFDRWSTGALTLLVGTVGDLHRAANGGFALSLVPQLGGVLFLEPSGTPPYPMVALTVEAQARYSGVGLFAGVGAALTYGPAGVLPAVPWRLGVLVGL